MYYLYYITSTETDTYYIGITKNPASRWRSHKYNAKKGTKTPLYDAMRSYGIETFSMSVIKEFEYVNDCCLAEVQEIKSAKEQNKKIYNLALGGFSGNVITDPVQKERWKAKLKEKRVGRKPALGMKHSEENKKLFGDFGRLRWDIHGRYPEEVINYSFKEASTRFGISKTHYYRLKKSRAATNDGS